MNIEYLLGSTKFRIIGILALLAIGISIPYILTSYQTSLVSIILISAILAASVNMMAGDGGLLSIGHAGIAASAGYGVAWALKHDYSLTTQVLLSIALTLVVSLVYGLTAMRTNGIFFLMVTLALGMVIFGLTYRMSKITGGENGLSGIRRPEMIAPYWKFYFFTLLAFVLVTVVLWVISKSPFGLVLRGIRDSESRMQSLGYNIMTYKLAIMMLSGVIAGLAGVLAVWQAEFVSPSSAGFLRSALTVLMVILGGIGTVFGPLIGASIVVLAEHVLSTHVTRWPTVLGLIFIIVILFSPKGIAGGFNSLVKRSSRKPSERDGGEPPEAISASNGLGESQASHEKTLGENR